MIDAFLNKTTMYRLVVYVLVALLILATLFSFVGFVPFGALELLFSTLFLVGVCWGTNRVFAHVYEVPVNVESYLITALILALIITPAKSLNDIVFLFFAGVLAMASKFVLSYHCKHIFNPVAVSVAITSIAFHESASWWIGTRYFLPFVLVAGFLIVRKVRRSDLVFYFLFASFTTTFIFGVIQGSDILAIARGAVLDSAIWFFAGVMLTEPLTTPPNTRLQIAYGTLTGILIAPQMHILGYYFTPETALLVGNLFSYLVSPKDRMILCLKEKVELGPMLYDFVFTAKNRPAFAPGQYLEWTLGHKKPDNRGNRRYFTIASSPTEPDVHLGVKLYEPSSTFKKALLDMPIGATLTASQLAGEFTLPSDMTRPCVFIAGGIGITPFRSMIKHLMDTKQKRQVVLFYCVRNLSELVYQDVFEEARKELGMKFVPVVADKESVPAGWKAGRVGLLDKAMIQEETAGLERPMYYLSGPHGMVTAFEKTLAEIGVKKEQIKTDFFPGFV